MLFALNLYLISDSENVLKEIKNDTKDLGFQHPCTYVPFKTAKINPDNAIQGFNALNDLHVRIWRQKYKIF